MSDDDKKCSAGDELHMGPETEGGFRMAVRHHDDHRMQPCLLKPIADGEAIPPGAELVHVKRQEGNKYSVRSIYKSAAGPAKVTTDEYRDGWVSRATSAPLRKHRSVQ